MPKVSICIPTYNTARYLPETIESVLAQDFTDYELVICDDVSSDNTPDVCARYDDPRIRYIRYSENAKQAGNFNRCLEEAQGEFLAILHADDFWLPGFLADRVKRLTDNPTLGFVFGTVQVVDADSKLLSTSGRWSEDQFFEVGGALEALLFGCIVCPPSMMVRKKSADQAGKFRTDLTWGHDWEWALRLAEQNATYFASEPLAAYRVHDASGTAEQLSAAKNGFQERRILQDTFARLAADENCLHKMKRPAFAALSRRHMYFAEQALLAEKRSVARNNLWYAALADASMIIRPTYWALMLGSVAPINFYNQYRSLRHSTTTAPR